MLQTFENLRVLTFEKRQPKFQNTHINIINITFFKVLLKLIKLITDIYYIVYL